MTDPGLYVHFPWCVRKCPYCDFNSHPLKGELEEGAYLSALLADFERQLDEISSQPDSNPEGLQFDTVFFGGGTPSLFSPESYARLLEAFAPVLSDAAEITMEANPGSTEHHLLDGYRDAGINRLSFGAQSFDDQKLKSLGRIHGVGDIYASFAAARRAGFDNINLDLMYGLPSQTRTEALQDLTAAIALEPEHLSWYQLTLEPRTEFAQRPPPLPNDLILEGIERDGYVLLDAAGLDRYEVSAYARQGRQCRHNINYWSFGDYLGIGAGAHGKLSTKTTVTRTVKASQPRLYLAASTATTYAPVEAPVLPGEFMLNALRLTRGVPLKKFTETTGLPMEALEPTRSQQVADGLLRSDRLAATERGYALLDSLIQPYL